MPFKKGNSKGRVNQKAFSTDIDKFLSDITESTNKDKKVVDIITFCNDPNLLNFLGQDPPINLWPLQRITLKMLYRGSRGNENLKLDDEEIEILKNISVNEDLDYDMGQGGFLQVLDKYNRGCLFEHLILVMGRRSSKTMMVSIIAAYEAYKLCECPEGNPQKYYGITSGKPIYIMNIANSEGQALDPLFKEIKARIANSPYFSNKINSNITKQAELYILTDYDKKQIAERQSKGNSISVDGSVILKSGHTNSDALVGKACISICFDEFAHMQNGEKVYSQLEPSSTQFRSDRKIVLLSDPEDKSGKFWDLFDAAQQREEIGDGVYKYPHDSVLALQLPTWCVNPFYTKEFAKSTCINDEIKLITAYGAKFLGIAGSKFFDKAKVFDIFDTRMVPAQFGNPLYNYYLHLDPATRDHNYALCLVHPLRYQNAQGEQKVKIFVDYIKVWRPSVNGEVKLDDVEKEIRMLARKFNIKTITFDTFQSKQTIQHLKDSGLNAFETPWNNHYINQVYGELKNLVNSGDVHCFPHELLKLEMECLIGKLLKSTMSIGKDKNNPLCNTDDCTDALAGATYQALQKGVISALPRSTVAYFPHHGPGGWNKAKGSSPFGMPSANKRSF